MILKRADIKKLVVSKILIWSLDITYTENKTLLESSNKNYLSQFQVMLYLN
jgi:hypothetical protein